MSAPQIQYPPTSGGGTPTGGSGTANTIPLWTGSTPSTTLTDSLLSQASTIITNSGTFRAANGAPAEPAYTFSGSSGTGMYRATSGALLRFAVSSAYAFGVDTNGNLGIGTPSPTATSTIYKANNSLGAWNAQDLSVDGLSNGDAVYQRWYATGIAGAVGRFGVTFQSSVASFVWNSLFNSGVQTAELMRLTGGGNLGIGTASPLGKLQVGSAATLSNYQASMVGIMLPTGSGNWLELCENSVNGTTFKIGKDASTGVTICGNSKDLGFSAGGYQSFVNSCQMVLKTSGNLGIGTASPSKLLSLYSANDPVVAMTSGAVRTWEIGVQNSSGALYWVDRTAVAERMRMDTSGRLGIGQTPTTYILETATDASIYGVRVGRGAGAQGTNTAVGASALDSNTTGTANTAIGYEALRANASATNSTAVGMVALRDSTGGGNTAFGSNAGRLNTTGINNTSVGHQAGYSVTTTSNNVSVGQNSALYQTGYNNTVVGAQAAQGALSASTGHSNTAIGLQAAYALTSGAQNTAVGSQAMYGLQGGSRNTAVGEAALYTNSTGTDNTAVGRYAAVFNTGNNNVAVGSSALNGTSGSSTGGNNVAVGMQSGQSITTGTNNVFVGYVAGSGVTTGQSNTMIGYATASGGTTTGGDNTLVGAVAGNQITSGANNVCIGSNAGQSQTIASDNAYVGKNAGYYQTGGANTAVGRSAMTGSPGVSNGQANAALGNSSLSTITSGSYNVCAGFNAGNNITTGSSNIVLGTDAQTAAAGDSNQLVLGSSARFVATNGGATTYYATAGASLGYIQVRLNGANVKIQVFAP